MVPVEANSLDFEALCLRLKKHKQREMTKAYRCPALAFRAIRQCCLRQQSSQEAGCLLTCVGAPRGASSSAMRLKRDARGVKHNPRSAICSFQHVQYFRLFECLIQRHLLWYTGIMYTVFLVITMYQSVHATGMALANMSLGPTQSAKFEQSSLKLLYLLYLDIAP